MACDLAECLQKFSLSKQEKMGIDLDKNDVAVGIDESRRSLFGKIHGSKKANFQGLRNTLLSIWVTRSSFSVRELGFNLYQFVFKAEEDLEKVFNSKVWTFDNQYLLLKKWSEKVVINEEHFDTVDLWIQVWNIPNHWISNETGLKIGKLFSQTLDIQIPESGSSRGRMIKLLVSVDLNQPLLRGRNVKLEDTTWWVEFKYENLVGLCYYCGNIGHIERVCSIRKEDVKQGVLKDGEYGEWMRADESSMFAKRNVGGGGIQTESSPSLPNKKDQPPTLIHEIPGSRTSAEIQSITAHIGGEEESSKVSGAEKTVNEEIYCPMDEEHGPFPNPIEEGQVIIKQNSSPLKENCPRTPLVEVSLNIISGRGTSSIRGGRIRGRGSKLRLKPNDEMVVEGSSNSGVKRNRNLNDEEASDDNSVLKNVAPKKQKFGNENLSLNPKVEVASPDWPQIHQ